MTHDSFGVCPSPVAHGMSAKRVFTVASTVAVVVPVVAARPVPVPSGAPGCGAAEPVPMWGRVPVRGRAFWGRCGPSGSWPRPSFLPVTTATETVSPPRHACRFVPSQGFPDAAAGAEARTAVAMSSGADVLSAICTVHPHSPVLAVPHESNGALKLDGAQLGALASALDPGRWCLCLIEGKDGLVQ